ncbi:MAG: hypothetical protein IJB16_06515 [Clostridia bacterium]|nr:hypothetical protein [Clostridia bacterium]
MKKLIALIAVLATVASLSACKMNKELTPEEKQSKYAAEESKMVAASIQAENDYIDGVNDFSENEIGKTIKGKKLVIRAESAFGYKYLVFSFNKKGAMTEYLSYEFYDEIDNYNVQKEIKNPYHGKKLVDTDDKARMVVYKYEEMWNQTFDEIYANYSTAEVNDLGYSIVE